MSQLTTQSACARERLRDKNPESLSAHARVALTKKRTCDQIKGLDGADVERSILGAILLDNSVYAQTEILSLADFSLDSHRRIYARIRDLAESSRPIDMITLVEELERRKELEAIGDACYISGLVDGVPERPSIGHYVRMVQDYAARRRFAESAEDAQRLDPSVEHYVEMVRTAADRRRATTLIEKGQRLASAKSVVNQPAIAVGSLVQIATNR
jgi:replicative DNA helicase